MGLKLNRNNKNNISYTEGSSRWISAYFNTGDSRVMIGVGSCAAHMSAAQLRTIAAWMIARADDIDANRKARPR
jgi:hypothetical protein